MKKVGSRNRVMMKVELPTIWTTHLKTWKLDLYTQLKRKRILNLQIWSRLIVKEELTTPTTNTLTQCQNCTKINPMFSKSQIWICPRSKKVKEIKLFQRGRMLITLGMKKREHRWKRWIRRHRGVIYTFKALLWEDFHTIVPWKDHN